MNKYELLFIISVDQTEEQREAIIAKLKKFIEDRSGVIAGIDKWGVRKLAYPIKFKNEGYYVLMNFESEASFPAELDRIYKITDGIMRSLIIRKDDDAEVVAKEEKVEEAKEETPVEAVVEEAAE